MSALAITGRRAVPVLAVAVALSGLVAVGTGRQVAHAEGGPVPASDDPACGAGGTVLTDVADADDWAPLTPSKWQFPGDEVILAERGTNPGPPRRPFEYAVLETGPEWSSVQVDAEVRIDEPVTRNDRDVIIVFGYRSPTQFNYAHISQDNTIYPHNGIFVVNDADRLRIDDQWNGSVGAPPAITDTEYHHVRVRHCLPSGAIEVFVDDMTTPLMTATDTTLASGRVGFGSFDNYGRARDVTVTGTPSGIDPGALCAGRVPTVAGTERSDVLRGTEGDDVITGMGGDDVVNARGGDDYVCGGDGADVLAGGGGHDVEYGGAGPDVVSGAAGHDTLYGGSGHDVISGGAGEDVVDQGGPEN